MRDSELIEFYVSSMWSYPFAHVRSSAVPRQGELVRIRQQTYEVVSVTWALDQPEGGPKTMRACVEVQEAQS